MADMQAKEVREPITLTAEEMAALEEGIRSAEQDRRYTFEEVLEFARQRRQTWKKAPKVASM